MWNQLHAVALFLYEKLAGPAGSHARPSVEGMLGPIKKDAFRQMKVIVDQLAKWTVATAKNRSRKGSAPLKAAPEFGAHLEFVLPAIHQPQPLCVPVPVVAPPQASRPAPAVAELEPEPEPEGDGFFHGDFDNWLVAQCASVLSGGGAEASTAQAANLAAEIQQMMVSDVTDDELQGSLFDLLGDFDLIGLLLSKRQYIAAVFEQYMEDMDGEQYTANEGYAGNNGSYGGGGGGGQQHDPMQPTIRIGVTMNTEQEKRDQQLLRKQERKQNRGTGRLDGPSSHADVVRSQREARERQLAHSGQAVGLADVVAALPADSGFVSTGWGQVSRARLCLFMHHRWR